MPKSKHRKNHKEKLQARKERLNNESKKHDKLKYEYIKRLIEQEKAQGLFNQPTEVTGGYLLDGVPDIEKLEGPVI